VVETARSVESKGALILSSILAFSGLVFVIIMFWTNSAPSSS
jgi:hypothetical protein